ncbi:MAG: hypothetical protein ABIP89_14310 [Polyangiaceae bacterium]
MPAPRPDGRERCAPLRLRAHAHRRGVARVLRVVARLIVSRRCWRRRQAALRPAVDDHGFDDPEVIGASSILESRAWYAPRGAIGMDAPRTLFRIDCGMSPGVDDSKGVFCA